MQSPYIYNNNMFDVGCTSYKRILDECGNVDVYSRVIDRERNKQTYIYIYIEIK